MVRPIRQQAIENSCRPVGVWESDPGKFTCLNPKSWRISYWKLDNFEIPCWFSEVYHSLKNQCLENDSSDFNYWGFWVSMSVLGGVVMTGCFKNMIWNTKWILFTPKIFTMGVHNLPPFLLEEIQQLLEHIRLSTKNTVFKIPASFTNRKKNTSSVSAFYVSLRLR